MDGTVVSASAPEPPPRPLRIVTQPEGGSRIPAPLDSAPLASGLPRSARDRSLTEALRSAEERARVLAVRIEDVRGELTLVREELARETPARHAIPYAGVVLRVGVAIALAGLLALSLWARSVDYALRVTSDTPTFLALVSNMAAHPFAPQSPFLVDGSGTQHATPYMQALAFLAQMPGLDASTPVALGRLLSLVGIGVFAFALSCVFVYVRRLAGSTAAWISIPVLLAVFGPPHVIWASDLSLHGALYAGFYPQTLAIGTMLLTLLVLERQSLASLTGSCALAALTMVVHPFTGVLLAILATAEGCRLAAQRDRAAVRAPVTLAAGFALGSLWPAYSLDRAFAETGARGIVFIGACVLLPAVAWLASSLPATARPVHALSTLGRRLASTGAAFRLALVGAVGTLVIAVWEWLLVRHPPETSARLAVYWVDERWRWPLLLVAGSVGLSGLARLARRGQILPAVWFAGCFAVGGLGAAGLPLPVWYRFLLLCQVPLAIGVAAVIADRRREVRTAIVVGATVAVALTVKVAALLETPSQVSYFGQSLQPVWSLGRHIPPGDGLVATDPATAYFIPATTGHRVLTVDKGHVSSRRELAQAEEGYRLLRRFYAGGDDWWGAAQQMWRRGVRYVVVAKQTTLEPKTLDDFIWQTARLRTDAQRRALGGYFYENNRIGTLIFDSPDYAVYRIDRDKLFGTPA
jgi:hypothetical protein